MSAFTEDMLKNNGVFIVDFSDNSLSKQLMLQIFNLDCLKIVIRRPYERSSKVDYNIYFSDLGHGFRKMSPYIKKLEDLFSLYKEK